MLCQLNKLNVFYFLHLYLSISHHRKTVEISDQLCQDTYRLLSNDFKFLLVPLDGLSYVATVEIL